jgi:hypothetical protein
MFEIIYTHILCRDSWLELLACYMHVDCVSLAHAIEPANWLGYQLVLLNTTKLECTRASNLIRGFIAFYTTHMIL